MDWRRRCRPRTGVGRTRSPRQVALPVAVFVDVLRNAARQHLRARPLAVRVAVALLLSALVELAALRAGLTRNILWPPSSPARALPLVALLACLVPVVRLVAEAARRRLAAPSE